MSKHWKPKPEDQELDTLLTLERNMQSEFYDRMAGNKPWDFGKKEYFVERLEDLSNQIKTIQTQNHSRSGAIGIG